MSDHDFIIVGAGSAGCVLANRLSENGRFTVLLLEAGGSDLNFWIWMPIGYGKTFYKTSVNWMYHTEPDPALNGRVSYWPRGKVLGGSSSINAMVYVRGQARDFDEWRDMGNPGWGWDDVLPYFRRSETNDRGGDAFRGDSGPLHVATMAVICTHFARISSRPARNFSSRITRISTARPRKAWAPIRTRRKVGCGCRPRAPICARP
ncbi:MAG: hypothetical protein RLZZ491_1474 [Pseudomonadota bacterium]|jgi:choline dehydrogenase